MRKRNNKTCIVCGKVYTFCNSCNEDRMKPAWMGIYHNENCKKLFETATDYLSKDINKDEARDRFNSCDLSYKKDLHHKIVEAIDEVMIAETKVEDISENVIPSKNEFKKEKFISKR